jgi:hypothetical protein
MRLRMLCVAAFVAVMALPGSAVGQTPTEDSVVGSGVVSNINFDLDAHSGPSGENPTGTAVLAQVGDFTLRIDGPVTCLTVTGNTAVIGMANSFGNTALGSAAFIEATDGGAADRIGVQLLFPPTGPPSVCPSSLGVPGGSFPVTSGNLVVTDAQPFPTTEDQCKNGGWRDFGVFKNQGDCVSYVATGGKNPPGGD